MALKLFVNTQAADLASALVRSQLDLGPVTFPNLVIGDQRDYEFYFVDGRGNFEVWSGDAAYTPIVAIGECGNPSSGTFTLTLGANTTSALAYNATPAQVQTALEALTSIGAGNCVVSGVAGKYYRVAFQGGKAATNMAEITGGATLLVPESVVSVDTLTDGGVGVNEVQLIQLRENPISYNGALTPITNGWSGKLSTRTYETVERFATAGNVLAQILQVLVQDPSGARLTYLKAACNVECTIIDPDSFAGVDKPTFVTTTQLAAAVLATGVHTREALTSSVAGNTNVTRPAGSRNHTAVITVSGAAGTRTFSILTTNTPLAGDLVWLLIKPGATAGVIMETRNASSVGTLLDTITTDTSSQAYRVLLGYTGSAWELVFTDDDFLREGENLAGLASPLAARANLKVIFSAIDSSKTASFTIPSTADGVLYKVSAAAGAVTVTFPSPVTGFMVAVQKTDASGFGIATSPATSSITNIGQTMVWVYDGSAWNVVANYNPVAQPVTIANVVSNRFDITGLTGGGTNLDGIVTTAGTLGVNACVLIAFGSPAVGQIWRLVAGTDAEASTSGVVRPDDYNAATNAVVWKQVL